RERVLDLMDKGMGLKRIAQISGVPHGSLWKLVYGKHGSIPSRTVTRRTQERIMNCPFTVADGARVDPLEAQLIGDELLARGWARAHISKALGNKSAGLQLRLDSQVTAGHVRALRRLMFVQTPARSGKWKSRVDPARRPLLIDPTTPGVPDEPRIVQLREKVRLFEDRQGIARALLMTGDTPQVRELARLVVAQ